MRHEPSDENVKTILITAGILAGVIAASFPLLWGVLRYFEHRHASQTAGQFPLAVEDNRRSVGKRIEALPAPRLEGLERQQAALREGRPRELNPIEPPQLSGYGPSDPPQKGYARIPIDVAMKRILEKGRLPTQDLGSRKKEEDKKR
jgi:hypothetical protein